MDLYKVQNVTNILDHHYWDSFNSDLIINDGFQWLQIVLGRIEDFVIIHSGWVGYTYVRCDYS